MGRLEAIRIFMRVAETNSFSRASDVMDMPRGTVSRTIQSLEEQLGVRLLSRNTRQVALTESGRTYYERCAQILNDLSEVEAAVNYVSARTGKLVPFEFEENGQLVRLTLRSKFAANEGIAYIDAGLRGLGLIQPSRYIVADMLEAGTLREILPELPCPAISLSIVYPHRSHISSATRAFTDWITAICHRHPDLKD